MSADTVGRILARNGLSRKVIERGFLTGNEEHRALGVEAQWRIPLRCRVYFDEAHRVGRAAERRWAWSLRGARVECYSTRALECARDFSLLWPLTRF